jgi:hypothetical protein
LLGSPITVFTDNKNNTFNSFQDSDHVIHRLLFLGIIFEYLPGKKNIVVDILSHLGIATLKFKMRKHYQFSLNQNTVTSIPNALIFRDQIRAKVKEIRERDHVGELW